MIREVLTLDRLRAMSPGAAAALLAVRRSDGADPHDAQILAAWLDFDPAHREAWARSEANWRVFDDGPEDEILLAMRQAARLAGPAATPQWQKFAAAAAAVVVLSGAVLTIFLRTGPGGPATGAVALRSEHAPPGAAAPQLYAAGPGLPHPIDLPDGSRLTLAAGSAVETRFAGDRRDLRLTRGRAFFDVAHDTHRPFVVTAGDRQVVAVGTRFDVRLDPRRVRVVLVEGRLVVRAAEGTQPPVLLAAGQSLDAPAGQPALVRPADISEVLDWQLGYVTFDDVTLATAVEQLNRGSLDQIAVTDRRVARLRISGRFQTGSVTRFGRTLAQIHPVRLVQRAPHRFEIVARH